MAVLRTQEGGGEGREEPRGGGEDRQISFTQTPEDNFLKNNHFLRRATT